MKSKLGVSVGLLGAAMYFAALFGGYVPVILLAGYVLLVEDNEWLRKAAVKTVAVMMSFAFATALLNLIPDMLSWIASIVYIFDGTFNYVFVDSIITVITGALDIIQTCLLLVLGVKALNQGTVSIPVIDRIINKYF